MSILPKRELKQWNKQLHIYFPDHTPARARGTTRSFLLQTRYHQHLKQSHPGGQTPIATMAHKTDM